MSSHRSSRASLLDRFVPSSALRNGHFAALDRTLTTGSNGSNRTPLARGGDDTGSDRPEPVHHPPQFDRPEQHVPPRR